MTFTELYGQNNPFDIKLCCPGKVFFSESSSGITLRTLDLDSLGSYEVSWPDELKNQAYDETAIMNVYIDSVGIITSTSFFKPLNNDLDSIALDIIYNCKSEFPRIIKEGYFESASKYGFLISFNFQKKE